MENIMKIIDNDENLKLRQDTTSKKTVSCFKCGVKNIKCNDDELNYHVLTKQHSSDREDQEKNNSDRLFADAKYNIERHGNLFFNRNEKVGEGRQDEVAYQGILKGSDQLISVKVLKKTDYPSDNIDREKKALNNKHKPNIVDLYHIEEDDEHYYIAYEQFNLTLKGWVESVLSDQVPIHVILKDAVDGLEQLHSFKSVTHSSDDSIHRNIRPENVLIFEGERYFAKISNLLMSKPIRKGVLLQSVSKEFIGNGYTAPELFEECFELESSVKGLSLEASASKVKKRKKNPVTKAVDVFSLGCVFYYALSKGEHLFYTKDQTDMQKNIRNPRYKLDPGKISIKIISCEKWRKQLGAQLVNSMVQRNPESRPTVKDVASNPFFWNDEKILDFFCDASDYLQSVFKANSNHRFLTPFKEKFNWADKVHPEVVKYLKQENKLRPTPWAANSGRSYLLRAIRNLMSHCKEDKKIAALVEWPDSYVTYWTKKFPELLFETYRNCQPESSCQDLKKFYPNYDFNRFNM